MNFVFRTFWLVILIFPKLQRSDVAVSTTISFWSILEIGIPSHTSKIGSAKFKRIDVSLS